jgi:hypothetical protein
VSTARSEAWVEAGELLAKLEFDNNITLVGTPVAHLDQWGAGVREYFSRLDAQLSTSGRARAAFVGAYVASSMYVNSRAVHPQALQTSCHLMRWLYERGQQEGQAWLDSRTML